MALDEDSLLKEHYAKQEAERGFHRLGEDERNYDAFVVIRSCGFGYTIKGVFSTLDKAVAAVKDNYDWIGTFKMDVPAGNSSSLHGGWCDYKSGDKV